MEKVYRAQPGDRPLDYPSLDVPFYKNATHAPEAEAAEKLASDPVVVVAASHIVAACGQLAASVHRPFFSLVEGAKAEHVTACLQYLEASNTVEILRAAGPEGMHVDDIAHRIGELSEANDASARVDGSKLSHILRLLATYHWLREVRPDVFANNRLSALVDSGKTPEELRAAPEKKYDGTDGLAAFVAMCGDEFFKSSAYMADALLPWTERATSLRKLSNKDGAGATSLTVREPKYETPFSFAFRTELGYFDWMELPENKGRLAEFGRAMTGARLWEVAENVVDSAAFPWNELPKDSVVIDVGGGVGSTSVVLANAYPHLRFVVEDRKQVVDIAPSIWGSTQHAELLASGRVSYLAQDFFQPQPPHIDIAGVGTVSFPSVYLVRGCTHNWPDRDVQRMLRLLRDSAGPTTKLLLVEVILPLACYDDTELEDAGAAPPLPGAERTLAPAGSPLLANLGKAHASEYLLDISMMAVLNAKERTLRELSTLALSAGWKVSRVTRAQGSLWAYTTAEPA
ncbi:S-adenosyl-L-methionine-dependent methyltransferase [Polyporus arcularius HHB13444]|uniref:S-adenosyl-L-methionine-dependent methyltransferase n=1 Tax=Polyporus arcularius HHB13444 TaxID=1314778 RepID=A0A5C3P399_9APHY|nr:S-adenosyl-L-methionine-dependent methyltransferase [Polyporus arcularius HHB13444]